MTEARGKAPTLEEPAIAVDPDWTEWGPVYDRRATVGVITALQEKGLRVRVVKHGNHNVVFVQQRSEP